MPGFAYDYLAAGCFTDVNLARNSSDIRKVQLKPWYLRDFDGAVQKTELFGEIYDAPFGVAPVGLQGLMWPIFCSCYFSYPIPLLSNQVIPLILCFVESKAK